PQTDIAAIVARAHTLAAGRPGGPRLVQGEGARESVAQPESPAPLAVLPPEPAPAVEQPPERDDALREIYARETSAHATAVRTYIERERRNAAEPHVLTEELYRACHTLSGSSKMAEARHGIRLAEPLDHWLR